MDRCDDIMDLLAGFMDRELDAATHERVRRHLESCADCRRELEGLERVDALFRRATAPAAEAGAWAEVEAALDRELERDRATVPMEAVRERAARRGWLASWWLPAVAVAAAAVLVAVFFIQAPPPGDPGIEMTSLEVGPSYEAGVSLPAKDGDFLIIDVSADENIH